MNNIPKQTLIDNVNEASLLDDLRAIAYGEVGEPPPVYPKFNFSILKDKKPVRTSQPNVDRIRITEKVTVWLDTLGQVVVEWLDALLPLSQGLSPLATRAGNDPEAGIRRVLVQSEYTHQPTIELAIHSGPPRGLTVRVGDWPNYKTDVRVRVRAGEWLAEGATNNDGEVNFTHLPNIEIGTVQVELMLSGN